MKLISILVGSLVIFFSFACTKHSLFENAQSTKKTLQKPLVQKVPDTVTYSYLALGDSYTIGESVPYEACFPAQAIGMLNKVKMFDTPVIIAKTGWTTDELAINITKQNLKQTFDFVSLLIGVNNQYRGRDTANYRKEFTQLLDTAIKFARNNTERVIVISIPDWGITPFGLNSGRNVAQISKEIDWFNGIAKWVAEQKGITFIDITAHSRTASSDGSLIAPDGLHPSGKMYAYWAQQLTDRITAKIK